MKLPKIEKHHPDVLDLEVLTRLLESYTGNPKDQVIITLAGLGGLRRGEVFGLEKQDFNFKKHMMSVRRQLIKG